MRTVRVLACCLLVAGLAGCAVTSETPLFAVDQAPRHPLKDGLWAASGPGCDVAPAPAGKALPECVGMTITVAGPRLSWELIGAPGSGVSTDQIKLMTRAAPNATDFVLVDGDPALLELLNGDTAQWSGPRPPGAARLSVGYNALRVLETDPQGRVVRGVIWGVPCPDDLNAPGFKPPAPPAIGACRAETAEAVRAQARHMKPFLSFFITWVR